MATYVIKFRYNTSAGPLANKEYELTVPSIGIINRSTGTVEYTDEGGNTVWAPFSSLVDIRYKLIA